MELQPQKFTILMQFGHFKMIKEMIIAEVVMEEAVVEILQEVEVEIIHGDHMEIYGDLRAVFARIHVAVSLGAFMSWQQIAETCAAACECCCKRGQRCCCKHGPAVDPP